MEIVLNNDKLSIAEGGRVFWESQRTSAETPSGYTWCSLESSDELWTGWWGNSPPFILIQRLWINHGMF